VVEELPFVDADDLGVRLDLVEQLTRRGDALRLDAHGAVRRDVVLAVAVVDPRLEDLHLALGNLRPAQPADQFLALAAEHAPGNDLDPSAAGSMLNVHLLLRSSKFGV